jgi:membrane peptidoglycan carboxypeptidase
MQVAVLTTEDGAFFHHRGFNHGAIKNSLIANLKARRFVRGASTISMQTAKNLFLTRDKTLGRKLEELILTDYLEQNFTKAEILEVYLNIIEFGPNVYGIVDAAEHYFGRKPEELNLAECLFLASVLPRPVGFHKLYEKGELSEAWMKNLHTLMEIAFKNGKISESELREGLAQTIVFYKPDAPRPVARPAIPGSHFTGDDQDWRQLN